MTAVTVCLLASGDMCYRGKCLKVTFSIEISGIPCHALKERSQ